MKNRSNRQRYTAFPVKENVLLKNNFNSGDIVGDVINEEEIEGKSFYVVRSNNRVFKVAKEAYTIRKVK